MFVFASGAHQLQVPHRRSRIPPCTASQAPPTHPPSPRRSSRSHVILMVTIEQLFNGALPLSLQSSDSQGTRTPRTPPHIRTPVKSRPPAVRAERGGLGGGARVCARACACVCACVCACACVCGVCLSVSRAWAGGRGGATPRPASAAQAGLIRWGVAPGQSAGGLEPAGWRPAANLGSQMMCPLPSPPPFVLCPLRTCRPAASNAQVAPRWRPGARAHKHLGARPLPHAAPRRPTLAAPLRGTSPPWPQRTRRCTWWTWLVGGGVGGWVGGRADGGRGPWGRGPTSLCAAWGALGGVHARGAGCTTPTVRA